MKKVWFIIFPIILSVIGSFVYDAIKDFPFLHSMNIFYNGFIGLLNTQLKLWWVLLGAIIFFCLVYFCLKIKSKTPDFSVYVKDKFDFYIWKWEWRFSNYKNAWVIKDLTAHCPKCETPLIESGSFSLTCYECPRCKSTFSKLETKTDIETLIIDNAKRGLWKSNR